jgi:hypothetical protein
MWALDRLLAMLDRLSLGSLLSDGARQRAVQAESVPEAILWRFRAASIIDWYIVVWLLTEIAVYLWGLNHIPGWLLVAVATYRIVEITQVFANAVLFEQRRSQRAGVVVYMVLSVPRSIVHAIVLLAETILCFGALIFVGRDHVTSVANGQDAVDFSLRTITTGGATGEAHGAFRLLVDVEPVLGLLFAGAVLARLVNAIPAFGDLRENLARLNRRLEEE